MRHWGMVALVMSLSLPGGAAPPGRQEPPSAEAGARALGPTDPAELGAFLDEVLNSQLQAFNVPGAMVAVVRDGQLLYARGYGLADIARQRPVVADETLFCVGSVSKVFTWTAVMQLVEQGRLDLDADINQYLKDFQVPATFAQPITLRHLMNHTAGFEQREVPTELEPQPLGRFLARHMPARVRPPGLVSSYSNYGTALAGYIVEQVSGMPFEVYMEKALLEPLDMRHSTFRQPLPPGLAEHLAPSYRLKDHERHVLPWGHNDFAPAGALSATATDMAKFMIAQLQDGRYGERHILREDTARRMHQRSFSHHPAMNGWAHGFMEGMSHGQRMLWHNGGTAGFYSELVLLPQSQVGFFVAYNQWSEEGAGAAVMGGLRERFLDHYYPSAKVVEPSRPMPGAAERARRYVGLYAWTRRGYTNFEKLGALDQQIEVKAGPDGTLLISVGGGPAHPWVEVEPALFAPAEGGAPTERLAFLVEEGGRASYLLQDTNSFGRISRWGSRGFAEGLLVACAGVFVSALIAWPLAALWRRRRRRPGARRVIYPERWAAGAVSAIGLGVLLCFLYLVIHPEAMDWSAPSTHLPVLPRVILLSGLGVALLTPVALVLVGRAWWKPFGSVAGRVHATLVACSAVLLVGWLNYWNLIGWRY